MKKRKIRPRLKLAITRSQRQWLKDRKRAGCRPQELNRVRILELLDKGKSTLEVAEALGVDPKTVQKTGWRYIEDGIEVAIDGYSSPGAAKTLTKKDEQRLVALACSDPPDGHARWTVRLLASEVQRRRIVKYVSKDIVHRTLKNHGIKPWREKNVVCS